ncbi:MAG: alpha/beta hydrolase [Bacteroidetes bacterium]|nr:alpha/beta hydrolase [Bacteroidota bacterium]
MKEIKVLGVSVNDYGGRGEPLVFVHSFPMNSGMWDRQVGYFRDKFRVITYDLRGMGKSSDKDNVFTMEKLVNDFFHIINNLKLGKVHACGLSMGGYILMRSAVKDPERFLSLAVVNTKSEKDDDETLLKRSNAVIKIKSGGRDTYIDKLIPGLSSSENEELEKEIRNIINHNSDEGICGSLLALSTRTNTLEGMTGLKVPVLLMSSTDDKITPARNLNLIFDKFAESGKTEQFAAMYRFSGCGHLCNMENPAEFNAALEWFLNCIEIERTKG